MIIIVEGIDRVGKTMLCNMLKESMNIETFKRKNFDKVNVNTLDNDNETDKMIQILNVFRNFCDEEKGIVFDRLHLSDYVYGMIERNYDENKAVKNFMSIEKYIADMHNAFLILVEPTDVSKSTAEHGSNLKIHKELFECAYESSLIKNKWKCTYNTLNEAIMFIKSKMEKENDI